MQHIFINNKTSLKKKLFSSNWTLNRESVKHECLEKIDAWLTQNNLLLFSITHLNWNFKKNPTYSLKINL